MDKEIIIHKTCALHKTCPGNIVTEKESISPEMIGLNIFDEPLIGFASATDELFEAFKRTDIVGPWFLSPREWLPEAKTVISLFFPYTEAVKSANRKATMHPAPEWLHGRIEGQAYLLIFIERLRKWFEDNDFKTCVPITDQRFEVVVPGNNFKQYSCVTADTFSSNWSERHVAYIAGLGTFGLSKGLITKKGMAGRFISIIISKELPADRRHYTGIYDYCNRCGVCVKRCPAQAISLAKGKDHNLCGSWLSKMGSLFKPRYGCGLCQTGVPCESAIPRKKDTAPLPESFSLSRLTR
ncbi:MAG: epoxyqueuosine reductase [Clostridiaceae bacterium]|nr:epoxyqueuosine reductase [Clostridiaceae bacterium]